MDGEHRETIHHNIQLVDVLGKIPLFRGLSDRQLRDVVHICARRTFAQDEVLCRVGDESWEMYVLLRGSLVITLEGGKMLSRLEPVETVGEMGLFTGDRRSATIAAATPAILLSIHKMELLKLFRHDSDLGIRVLLNVISELSGKLRRDNEIIQELRLKCPPGTITGVIEGAVGNGK